MHTLITGGHGLLGSELKKLIPNAIAPPQKKLDIRKPINLDCNISLVIHCAALKTIECDKDKKNAVDTNIIGTYNVVEYCRKKKIPMIYISTDYVFKGDRGDYTTNDATLPQNYYAETKLAGEIITKSLEEYLIIRLSFYPNEFPYDKAFKDQYTTRLTVSEAAQRIVENRGRRGICHIAGPKQSVYEFAIATSDKIIEPISINDEEFKRPKDTSLVEN